MGLDRPLPFYRLSLLTQDQCQSDQKRSVFWGPTAIPRRPRSVRVPHPELPQNTPTIHIIVPGRAFVPRFRPPPGLGSLCAGSGTALGSLCAGSGTASASLCIREDRQDPTNPTARGAIGRSERSCGASRPREQPLHPLPPERSGSSVSSLPRALGSTRTRKGGQSRLVVPLFVHHVPLSCEARGVSVPGDAREAVIGPMDQGSVSYSTVP
jgi:hypothetical protein